MRQIIGLAATHPHAPIFCAAAQGRNRLAGIQQLFDIERALHGNEHFDFFRRELDAHLIYFFDADTVLAGNGAANLDRKSVV